MKDITIAKARILRRNMTEAEQLLWSHLRCRQLNGYKFRRQHPLPPYIADFCCIEQRLIIELDGSPHSNKQEYDKLRSQHFASKGYVVLRFWNSDVFENTAQVLDRICRQLESKR